jgi:hypothetical protein
MKRKRKGRKYLEITKGKAEGVGTELGGGVIGVGGGESRGNKEFPQKESPPYSQEENPS